MIPSAGSVVNAGVGTISSLLGNSILSGFGFKSGDRSDLYTVRRNMVIMAIMAIMAVAVVMELTMKVVNIQAVIVQIIIVHGLSPAHHTLRIEVSKKMKPYPFEFCKQLP